MTTSQEIIEKTEAAFVPVCTRTRFVVARAEGCKVWDPEGREFLDLTAGWGVTGLGHCHPALVEAIKKQAESCLQAPNCHLSYTESQALASEALVRTAPGPLSRVFFTHCGSEATEGAIQLTRRATGPSRPMKNFPGTPGAP